MAGSVSAGQAQFKLTYELSPIILTGGIAQNMPGASLPIINLTQGAGFSTGVLGGASVNLDDFFAYFRPLPGTTLADFAFGEYPFANQAVAANAIIFKPLHVSMLMVCPVKDPSGYLSKLAVMSALQSSLQQHAILGGTYTVSTPSYQYTNCLLASMRHVSDGDSKQAQVQWQLDFEQPLLTQQQAQQAQNNLMSKITAGTPVTPNAAGVISYSGLAPTVNVPPSIATPGLVPSAGGVGGAGIAGLSSLL